MKKITILMLLSLSQAFAFKLGVTNGPHAMIAEEVAKVAKKDGLNIEVIEFGDFMLPNVALNDGKLDANSFQHQPYLDYQIKTRGFDLISVGTTVLMPMGIYSNNIKELKELKEEASIGIPNDPTNSGRALLLLEKEGLISLKKNDMPSLKDVQDNPKKLKITELDAPQLPRALQDLDAAVINTDWILVEYQNAVKEWEAQGKKKETEPVLKQPLVSEALDSPYTNILVVRTPNESNADVLKVLKAYRSAEVKKFVEQKFGTAIKFVG